MLDAHLSRIWCSTRKCFLPRRTIIQLAYPLVLLLVVQITYLNQAALAYSCSMKCAYLGSADFPDIVEIEVGRVVVICSQSTEIWYIKMWDFFFSLLQSFALFCVMTVNIGTIQDGSTVMSWTISTCLVFPVIRLFISCYKNQGRNFCTKSKFF